MVIQIGAICAVLILYFHKLNPFSPRKTAVEKKSTWRLWGMVVVGCIPAAILGFAFDDWVSEHFYNKVVVASMLILYGVIFIVLERRNRRRLSEAVAALDAPRGRHAVRGRHARLSDGDLEDEAEAHLFKITSVDDIDWKTALKIGCFQVLAMIPGTSRSGSTIIGGMLCGCSRTAAAEFTFFAGHSRHVRLGPRQGGQVRFERPRHDPDRDHGAGGGHRDRVRHVGRVHQVPHGLHQEERLHGVRVRTASSSACWCWATSPSKALGMLPSGIRRSRARRLAHACRAARSRTLRSRARHIHERPAFP